MSGVNTQCVLKAALRGALADAPMMDPDPRAWLEWLLDPTCRECGGVGSIGGQSTVTGCLSCGGTNVSEGNGFAPAPRAPVWFAVEPENTVALEAMFGGDP